MRLDVRWEGVPELDSRIEQLIQFGLDEESILMLLMPGAELMAERWKGLVPVPGEDHPYSTGEYHDSIRVERGEDSSASEWGLATLDVMTDAVNPIDGFNYPEALEMGTDDMPAQPSAIVAFDETVDESIELAARYFDEVILRLSK